MSRFYVGSEVGKLHRVLIHRPELALRHLTPSNCNDLLFDDVLRIDKAEEEHKQFANVLREEGVEVFLLKDLLEETLELEVGKNFVLDRQISEYRYGPTLAKIVRNHFESMNCKDMASHLLGGLTVSELNSGSKSPVLRMMQDTDFILDPIPNHLFTRDTSNWVYGGVSTNPMMKPARKRETVHLRAIYNYHPMFANADFINYFGDSDQNFEASTIEGGDVLVIGRGTVLIGMSERSTPQGVELLARELFRHKQAIKVIAIELPRARSCMHLDTVFTHMDIDAFTYYPDIMKTNRAWEITPKGEGELNYSEVTDGFIKSIEKALGLDYIRMIPTGGDIFEAEREQWNDANNVLAVRPGTVVTYERNKYTIDNMQKAGINVLTIPGEELGRGRGGARCMSCPMERDDI